MKQYIIKIRIMKYETFAGIITGDSHEVLEICKRSKMIKIIKNDELIYSCVSDNIEIVEENDEINVYLYNTSFEYK